MYKAHVYALLQHGGLPRPDDARRAVSRAGIPLSAPQMFSIVGCRSRRSGCRSLIAVRRKCGCFKSFLW
jgi:hypothetical protein